MGDRNLNIRQLLQFGETLIKLTCCGLLPGPEHMADELFTQLFESVKHMDETVQGKLKPSGTNRLDETNVKSIREKTGLSQSQFALIIGVKLKTLQNWEQGRRNPVGPARALLKIFQADPERAIKALHGELPRKNLRKMNGY